MTQKNVIKDELFTGNSIEEIKEKRVLTPELEKKLYDAIEKFTNRYRLQKASRF